MSTKSFKLVANLSRIREIGIDFKASLRDGSLPRIEDYLSDSSSLHSGLLLCELLAQEVVYRQELGEQPDVVSFQHRFSNQVAIVNAISREGVDAVAQAHRIQDVYSAACQLPSTDQHKFVEECCGDAPELLKAIAALLCGAVTTELIADLFSYKSTSKIPRDTDADRPPVQAFAENASFCAERFQILRELGSGGNGVVYEAWDRDRKTKVALKALIRTDVRSIDLFKREFRVLADVTHPNLVSLYELFLVEPGWFLTMELVKGMSFNQYIRNRETNSESSEPCFDLFRLRMSIRQLAQGIVALHQAGVLHRDLKSSNVLVTETGRVVVLDFGLAAILDHKQLHQVTDQAIAGTYAYMSPEQAAGLVISPASDWYSFGTMLYEALTGRLPFLGPTLQVLMNKQNFDPPIPSELVSAVPEDLDQLCAELLRRNPDTRPCAAEILERLGVEPPPSPSVDSIPSRGTQGAKFVGRQLPLEQLHGAFRALRSGVATNILIGGSPGVGKSALVRQFLESLPQLSDLVVLSGRCYERESVPYKALDALVDSLAAYLASLPAQTVEIYLPIGTFALARVFPALRRVKAVANATRGASAIPDQQELRRRAFRALRELLCRLGSKVALILVIDDLHWSDVDSALLLAELLRPPDAPIMLLVGTFRSEDINSPFLSTLHQARREQGTVVLWQELAIDPLSPGETRSLAMTLPGVTDRTNVEIEAIVRESRGNPYFLRELVLFLRAGAHLESGPEEENEITLARVLWSRISGLPVEARTLMEVIAVSGRPLRLMDAQRAAGVDSDEQLRLLRAVHLIRSTGPEPHSNVECYHDCIRESVIAHISSTDLQEHHRNLAATLESAENPDPEHLALHFEGCEDRARASQYYCTAAARAVELLAFDRAAQLYARAINLAAPADREIRSLHVSRGNALANAGRGWEASQEYLVATNGALAAEKLDLYRRAAVQSLISGHVDEGLESLRIVLESSGMRLPKTPHWALIRLLWYRFQLRICGMGFRQRDVSQITSECLSRIDTCWSVAVGLSMIDPIRAACFMAYGLLLALKSGEPYRIARALAMEAVHESSTAGPRGMQRVNSLFRRSEEIAANINSPHALGLVKLAQGWAAHLAGNFRVSLEKSAAAEKIFRERCTGVSWELDTSQIYQIFACAWLGDFVQFRSRLTTFLKESGERGDLYAEMTMSGPVSDSHLFFEDHPDSALLAADEMNRRRSSRGFTVQHFSEVVSEMHVHLYALNGSAAWSVARERRIGIRTSLLIRVQFIRIWTAYLCGRCALAAASGDALLLREAKQEASRLLSERVAWARPFATQILAGVASQKDDWNNAKNLFASAAREFDEHGMAAYASASRRRYGELLGGQAGAQFVQQSDAWMRTQSIKNPERASHIFAPQVEREPNSRQTCPI